MKDLNFPIFKTKTDGISQKFDLNDPKEREKYFFSKAEKEIEKLRDYFNAGNTFVAYLLGKKNSGKGTYAKLFTEVFGQEKVGHIAVGDIVRDVHKNLSDEKERGQFIDFLEKNYRGFQSLNEIENIILGRDTTTLLPAELILSLIKFEISKRPKQALFIDGFPRAVDQVGYSLFLKELIGYRDDPDFFIFIDVPESVIDERIRYRVVCPRCHTPRSLRLLTTKKVGFDKQNNQFYLMCDNPECKDERMVVKEGDELGIEPIRKRLETDEQIFIQLLSLTGIPKIYLRNSVPVDKTKEYIDDYEITPAYYYEIDKSIGNINTIEKPWIINDDNGVPSHSLLPAAVELSLIKQTVDVLGL